MSELRKTVKFGSIYLAGVVFSKAVSFIMLPIYTRYLTPKDYGILELLSMTIDIVIMIMGVGLARGVFRFYSKYEDKKDKNEVISTVFILMFILNLIGFLVVFLLSPLFAQMLFGSLDYIPHFRIMALTMIFQASVTVPLMYYQAIEKPHLFVLINFIKLLMQVGLNVFFVVFMEMKVLGVLYSTLISGVAVSLYLIPSLIKKVGLTYSKEKALPMFKFGVPLILTGFASFYLNFSDRFFLKYYADLSEVGIYSLGYKFGFLLMMLVIIPFGHTWDVQRFNVCKLENARETFQKVFVMISFVLITVAFLLSIGCRDLIRIMASPEFESAYKVIPIILLAFIFQAWTGYVNFGIFLAEKTIHTAKANIIAAITVTIFCYLLIPCYGSLGAAYATLIAFVVRFFWIKHKSYQFYHMGLKWRKPLFLLLLAVCIIGISLLINEKNIYFSIANNVGLTVVFIASILLLPILPMENKLQLIKVIKNPISGIKELNKNFSNF